MGLDLGKEPSVLSPFRDYLDRPVNLVGNLERENLVPEKTGLYSATAMGSSQISVAVRFILSDRRACSGRTLVRQD